MVSRRLLVLVPAGLALAVTGCGAATKTSTGSFRGEARQVATTLGDLQAAGRKRDAQAICSRYLATALVVKIKASGKRTCEATLDKSLKDVDAFDLKVVDKGITVTGTTATAKVRSASGTKDRTDTLTLVKEPQRTGGRTVPVWKLSALGG